MSEETNDGTWSGLKKTIVGTLSTVITGGGVWLGTTLYGSHDEPKEETKTEQSGGQSAAPVIVNVQQNQENKQKVDNGGGTVIRERVIEKPAAQTPAAPVKKEEESW
jgi:hypothetical protein